jgi:hypothetical protein
MEELSDSTFFMSEKGQIQEKAKNGNPVLVRKKVSNLLKQIPILLNSTKK